MTGYARIGDGLVTGVTGLSVTAPHARGGEPTNPSHPSLGLIAAGATKPTPTSKEDTNTMTDTDIKTIDCRYCGGTGEIDPTDHLDLDSIEALRKELAYLGDPDRPFSYRAASGADRLLALARVGFISSRLIWLETTGVRHAEYDLADRARGNQRHDHSLCDQCNKPATG